MGLGGIAQPRLKSGYAIEIKNFHGRIWTRAVRAHLRAWSQGPVEERLAACRRLMIWAQRFRPEQSKKHSQRWRRLRHSS